MNNQKNLHVDVRERAMAAIAAVSSQQSAVNGKSKQSAKLLPR
jgi:hypothetical protein